MRLEIRFTWHVIRISNVHIFAYFIHLYAVDVFSRSGYVSLNNAFNLFFYFNFVFFRFVRWLTHTHTQTAWQIEHIGVTHNARNLPVFLIFVDGDLYGFFWQQTTLKIVHVEHVIFGSFAHTSRRYWEFSFREQQVSSPRNHKLRCKRKARSTRER